MNGFALGIENALLQRNINVSFHGDGTIIRQDQVETRRTTDLAQPRKLCVEVSQSAFQHLVVLGVLGSFELLDHSGARQEKAIPLVLADELVWGGPRTGLRFGGASLRLLFLDRLALPSAGYGEIIFPQQRWPYPPGGPRAILSGERTWLQWPQKPGYPVPL